MDKITFGDSYTNTSDPKVGVRRQHAIEAIQSADKIQNILVDDDSHLAFTKYISAAKSPYIIIVIALNKDNQLSILHSYKIFPTLVSNIKNKTPLELLEHLANQFGLEFKISTSEIKKFFLKEKILVNNISMKNNISIHVENPQNHNFTTVTLVKIEPGNVSTTINCSLGFCLDKNICSQWVKSNGENSYYNKEVLRVQKFATEKVIPSVSCKVFSEKVFISVHDFCFYCRQHPQALSTLYEEQIRDLFLIVIKTVFSTAEGEPFHYDGKLDFKITNPENKYEIITGEFKWWRGHDSAHEIIHQSIRKHATGQELDIYTVVLSKNRNAASVFDTVKSIFSEQLEIDGESFVVTTPEGSKEMFGKFTAKIRDNKIPLHLALGDLFFEKT